MITKNSQTEKEYATKLDIEQAVEKLVNVIGDSFNGMNERMSKRFDTVENRLDIVESTMATKQDILNVMDKMTPNHKFDALATRVTVLEEKIS